MHPTALVLVPLATLALPCGLRAADTEANNYWVRASVSAWLPNLSGDLAYQSGSSSPSTVSSDFLGLGDTELAPMLDLDVKPPFVPLIPNLRLGFYHFDTEGSKTLTQNFTYGGRTYPVGTTVSTEATFTDLYTELNWQPLDLDLVGVGFGLGLHSLQARLAVSGSGSSEAYDELVLIPVLALRAHVNPLDMLAFEAEINGLSLNAGDFDGTFADLRLQAIWRPLNWLGVLGGYRHIMLDAEIEDGSSKLTIDLSLSGPFLGALAQF